MANEWNVVSEEPARPARVASGPQASAAADPWAVVDEAPEGVIHDLPPVRAETSAVGQQILGAFSEIMGGAQPRTVPIAQITTPQDFRAPIETAAMRDRRRAATMAGSVFAEAPPERTAGELASDLYDRGRIGVRNVASGLVDLANVPQYAINTLNASAEGWARMLGSDLDIPTLPAYDWTRGTQAELAREQDAIRAGMSPTAIRQAAEFGATDGIVAPLSYLLANPGEAAGFAIEQASQFLTAGLPGGVGAKLAGAGLMAGGQTGAQVAAENQRRVARGEITQDEADQLTAQAAISSGVVNSMLQRIVPGGTAIEEAMAGARQAGLSRARGAALGGLGEGLSGFGEEYFDQIAQNEGTGRPALEGALKAGTLGAIMEGGIGSLAGAYSAGGRAPAQPESREQRQPPAADAPRTNAIAPEMLAAGNEALREQAAPPRRRAAAEAGAVIDDRLQALRDAAGRRLPDEERAALAAEAADLEALVREQDALSAAGVMGSPETRLTAAERAQADQRRAEIRAALEADRAAAEYGRQLQTLERQLGNIDTDAGLIDLAERIAGTPVDTGGKPAVQRAPQQSAANATGENRVQDQEDRRQAEGRAQAEGQGQAQEVVAAEGGSGVSATPAVVPASSLEGGGGNVSATGEGAAGGEQSRLDLIDAWRAATTADERAAAAQRIAEHDARAADRGRAGGEARAGDGARREASNAGAVPADVRGAGEQAPASRQVRDAAAGRVADRYQDTDDADIRAALGSAARGITVHRSIAELHPDDRDRLGVRESDDDIEGLYDPDTGRVHIFEANLDTASMPAAARRAWVAAHERSGHAGLRGMFADAGKSLTATLRRARQNPTIDAMVRAMEGGERPERGDILVEEAIVELGAAVRTGDFSHIRDRYGVDVSPEQRSAVRDFIGRIVSAVREALGKPAASMSDADVWRLIEDANRYAKRGEVRGTSRRARAPVASRARRTVTATTSAGRFQLTDEAAPAGTDFSEFGEVRQVIARDGDKQIGKLVYANDGTPPTIEVAPEYRRRGVATAMLKLAREQGGVLGDARSGMRRDGGRPSYRTDAGQAFREGADESRVTLADYMEQRGDIAARDEDGVVASRRTPGPDDPLPGAPKVRGATGPDPKLVAVAERYAADNGIDLRRQAGYVKADPKRGARIAAAYEAMKHDPQNPRVRRAYASLIEQTRAQYDALEEAGYRFYFTDPAADPYNGNPWDAMRDLRENSRMGVFPTDAGFGSGATDIDVSDNPLMADTGLRWPFGSERGELRPVLANDLFRAVHDAFGHGLEGAGFRADGEENAWQAHVRLFTGDAVGAITTETRGQNSWLNFGPYGESNRTAKVEDTVFADQKTGLMPEWTWTEGRAGDMPVASRRAATLNIGLSTKELRGGGELTEAEVLSAVKASGVKVLKATRQVSDSEPTLVIDIDRKLTKDEGDRISAALDQEAIVQRHDSGDGELFGPMAERWSPYNPAWFVMHDGGRASDGPIASRRTPFSAKKRQPDAVSDLFPNEGATKRTKSSVRRVVDSSGRSAARGNVNSRGKAISPIKQGLDNFWRWFGDSVAIDEKERPLVLFHATAGDFDTFETGRKTKNSYGILGEHEVTRSGIFLTPEISAAEEYVEGKSGASVMQLYAKLEDPLDLSSGGLSESDYQRMLSSGVNPHVVTRAQSYWEMFDNEDDGSNSFVDALREAGYDGAIFYEQTNDRRDALTYVVFDPGQVKSVTGNTGTFSAGSKSIIASRRASGFSAKKRQPDAVSADAYHYSNTPGLTELDPSRAGTAGAGRGRRRFGMGPFGKQGGTAARLGFYVREPGAEIPGPESVVRDAGGQHLYRSQLSNLYDLRTDPRGYADEAGSNQDYLEELISDGGFDGFLAGSQPGIDTPTAVVFDIGKKKIPVEAVEDDGVVASRRSSEPFYSAALRAIEAGNGAPRRGTAEQWKGWLDGAVRRGEMKQSERDWLGIDDWIAKQGGAVTREALADFIRANEVKVEEVTLGEDGAVEAEVEAWWNDEGGANEETPYSELSPSERREARERYMDEVAEYAEGGPATKFAEYQLPGGENYRELLLTLPQEKVEAKPVDTRGWTVQTVSDEAYYRYTGQREIRVLDARGDVMQSRAGFRGTDEEAIAQAAKAFQRDDVTQQRAAKDFRSSHFDQPNILAHVRFNERTDSDGKRVLFIEEIQSDWHQQGRKHGYAKPQPAAAALTAEQSARRNELLSSGRLTDAEAAELGALNRQRQAAQQGTPIADSAGAPDAPFKATDEWAMLAFKRMVRHAAENGFDRIAWTTGEQQAERYDLSKQVSQIRVIPGAANSSVPVGMRRVIIAKSDGTDIDLKVGRDGLVSAGPFNAGFNGKSLDDVVGKEIAERIMAAEKETALRGDGLRVGGSGMRGFYDNILPKAVNKWAKKFGGKVGQASIVADKQGWKITPPSATVSGRWMVKSSDYSSKGLQFDTEAEARAALAEKQRAESVHAIDLTPAMRDAALEGQPLFSRRTPQQAQAERGSLFGRLAASGYAMGSATQPQPGGRFVSLQRAADGLRVKLQDKMLPALRVQERATAGEASQAGVSTVTLDDMQNAYRMESLRHGATKEGVDKLNDEHVMPIQRALRDAGFSLAMFEDYLYALAAPERNASIAQINRGMPDAGSGIATQQARDILAGRAPGVYSGKVLTPDALRLFKSLEPHVRAIRNIALDSAVEAGQLPAQLARALRQKYPNYVPMRGKDDVLDQARTAAGRGLSQARSGMKRALGRGQDNIPQNVLGELIGDAQRGISAREQSKATKAFLRFALANPMPELFEVEPVDLEWKFSESTGEAYLGVKGRAEDVDSKMIVMQDGKPVYVKFHDEGLRDAILNMGADDFAGFTKWAGWLNRWRSAVLTRFNPAFPPVNIMRDILFGGTAVSTELGAAAAARAAGIYPRAMAAAWAHARGRRGDASVPDAQKTIADWVQEFYETGGSTGLTMTEEPADLQRKLEMASMATGELMKLAAKGRPLAASAEAISRAGKPIIDIIESANEASENALRIATYIEQRQRGVSKFKAAEYAKNVTINFNRKGQYGPALNALFLFYNAAMQGTHAVVRVMRNPKAMAFLAGMGALQAMLAASMMGDDDDDGITHWDTVPDYVKRTALVIPAGDDRYFAIPMPYGFNLITYAAGRATQHAYSGRRPTDSNVALDILKSATEAFSPIPIQDGYSALFGDQLAFFMRLGANRDDFGGKLTNTDDYSDYPVPLALQGKATTPRIYHSTAQLLAKLGGGDLAEKIPPVGYLDVSPEQLEAVTSYLGGGITSLLNKSMTWGEQMQAGNLRGVSDVVAATPIASRFYGKPSDARAIANRYYGERGEFARHRAIVNERVAAGMSLEEAKADRPKEYVKGLDQGTYKRSGKRKDGSRYRAGEKRPGIQETEGTPAHTAKDVRKRVSSIGELIAGVREGMTNAELSAAYSAQHRIARQTVGSNFMPEGMTGKPADLGLPDGFAEAAPAPARVKNRAIKLLQDLRAAEEQRLLRALQFQRRLDSVKMPAQQALDQAKFDRDFEAMFGGDNFDPEAISP